MEVMALVLHRKINKPLNSTTANYFYREQCFPLTVIKPNVIIIMKIFNPRRCCSGFCEEFSEVICVLDRRLWFKDLNQQKGFFHQRLIKYFLWMRRFGESPVSLLRVNRVSRNSSLWTSRTRKVQHTLLSYELFKIY